MKAAPPAERAPPSPKQILAVAVGNGLEFYDFLSYGFFAAQIGRTFFPSTDPIVSLLASLATFGIGFLGRPIGAVVIGLFADRVGRKPAMILSFALMGFGMAGLALTPSFHQIGVAAPILAVIFRLIQGFALGGELGPSTAFMIEAAPRRKRGLYVSFQYMGQDAAVLLVGIVGEVLSQLLTADQLDRWGWRLVFGIGFIIVPFGLILRRSLVETLDPEARQTPLKKADLTGFRVLIALSFITLASGTITAYVFNYLTTYANSILHMPTTTAFSATIATGLVGVTIDPLGGWLSDRFGRKTMMIWPWLALAFLVWPAFWAIGHFRSGLVLVLATLAMTVPASISGAANLILITESLPLRIRASSLAIVYALAISMFGGTTQYVVTWLTDIFKDPLMPAFYMTFAVILGWLAMLFMKESAPIKVDRLLGSGIPPRL